MIKVNTSGKRTKFRSCFWIVKGCTVAILIGFLLIFALIVVGNSKTQQIQATELAQVDARFNVSRSQLAPDANVDDILPPQVNGLQRSNLYESQSEVSATYWSTRVWLEAWKNPNTDLRTYWLSLKTTTVGCGGESLGHIYYRDAANTPYIFRRCLGMLGDEGQISAITWSSGSWLIQAEANDLSTLMDFLNSYSH